MSATLLWGSFVIFLVSFPSSILRETTMPTTPEINANAARQQGALVPSTPRVTHNSYWMQTINSMHLPQHPCPTLGSQPKPPRPWPMDRLFSKAFGEDNQTAHRLCIKTSPIIQRRWPVCKYQSEQCANQCNVCGKFVANHVRFKWHNHIEKLLAIVNATNKLFSMQFIIGIQHVPCANKW